MKYRSVDSTGNGFCGPMTLAAILGCTTAEAAERIRTATNQTRAIKGTHTWEMEHTLAAAGCPMVKQPLARAYITDRLPGFPTGVWTDYAVYRRDRGGPVNGLDARYDVRPSVNGLRPYDCGTQWAAPFTQVKHVGPTLAAWMRQKRDPAAFYIIEVSHHWVLVRGRKFIDTATKGEWVFLRSAPHRRKRVINVWSVTK